MKRYEILVDGKENRNTFLVTFIAEAQNENNAQKLILNYFKEKQWVFLEVDEINEIKANSDRKHEGIIQVFGRSFYGEK